MDTNVEQAEGREVFEEDWAINLQAIIEEKIKDKLLLEARYAVPYVSSKKSPGAFYEVSHKDLKLDEEFYYMYLFIKRKRGGTQVGLRLTFPGTVKDETYVKFENNFYYRWDNRSRQVNITYYLGSLKEKVLKKGAVKLFEQCKYFQLIYTEEGKKKLNKN